MFIFEKAPRKAVLYDFGHGRYFDAWSLVHFASGVSIGGVGIYFGLTPTFVLTGGLLILFLYELFESLIKIVEGVENSIADVLVGFAGIVFIVSLFVNGYIKHIEAATAAAIFAALGLAGLYVGWQRHLRKIAGRKSKKYSRRGLIGTIRDNIFFFGSAAISLPAVALFIADPKLSVLWFALTASLVHALLHRAH